MNAHHRSQPIRKQVPPVCNLTGLPNSFEGEQLPPTPMERLVPVRDKSICFPELKVRQRHSAACLPFSGQLCEVVEVCLLPPGWLRHEHCWSWNRREPDVSTRGVKLISPQGAFSSIKFYPSTTPTTHFQRQCQVDKTPGKKVYAFCKSRP
jgi:hypothetical protein